MLLLTDICPLLFELSHHDRLRILRKLEEEPMIVTRISEDLELTVQETSRHLSRLAKLGLTERDAEGAHFLTRNARLSLRQLPSLEFTFSNREYFKDHSTDRLPAQFLSRLGELQGSELVEDVMMCFYNVDRTVQNAREWVWYMTDQYLPSQIHYVVEALERGVKVRNIDAPFTIPVPPWERPREWSDASTTITEAREANTLEEKLLDPTDVYMCVSEQEVGALAFPLADGKFDYAGFTSKDESARRWCMDLFEYYWRQARPRLELLDELRKVLVSNPKLTEALRLMGEKGKPSAELLAKLENLGFVRRGSMTYVGRVLYLSLFGNQESDS